MTSASIFFFLIIFLFLCPNLFKNHPWWEPWVSIGSFFPMGIFCLLTVTWFLKAVNIYCWCLKWLDWSIASHSPPPVGCHPWWCYYSLWWFGWRVNVSFDLVLARCLPASLLACQPVCLLVLMQHGGLWREKTLMWSKATTPGCTNASVALIPDNFSYG